MTDLRKEYDYCWEIFSRQFPELEKPKMYVRKMRQKWGVCVQAAESHITLNRCLQKSEVEFVRHVIFHEMSHLLQPNHKREFYDLLKQFDTLQIRENEKINHRVERLKQRAEAIRKSIEMKSEELKEKS
jgi:predicted metal-dependent hydrolase